MKLTVCTTCWHSTMDHGGYGLGACLLDTCTCAKMVPGADFVKPPHVFRGPYKTPLNELDDKRAAAKRAAGRS